MNRIRRLINNRQDNPESQDSTSPSKSNDVEEQGAEGFLCPTCILAFPSPESLQAHFESTHIDGAATSVENDEINILICPACKMRFPNEHFLQSHYNRHHGGNDQSNKASDLQALKMEVAELKTSLKEEKWHSEELKKEVDRLHLSVVNKIDGGSDDVQVELEMLRLQNKALDESKSLLTSEILLLRQQLTDSYEVNKELKDQRERIEQRSASMSAESADVKSKLDEETSNKTSLEIHIHELQNEVVNLNLKLDQRPSADDVQVLKQELVSVQTLMDQLSLQKEDDKNILQFELTKLQAINIEVNEQKNELQNKLDMAPRQEEVETLTEMIKNGSSGSEKLQQCLQEKEQDVSDLKLKFQKMGQEITELARSNEEANQSNKKLEILSQKRLESNEHLEAELNRQHDCINEQNSSLQQKDGQLKKLEIKVNDLDHELKSSRDSNQSAFSEREQSYSHLQMEMQQVQNILKEKESEVLDLSRELSTVQQHYQEAVALGDDYKAQIREKELSLEEQQRLYSLTLHKFNESGVELSEKKKTVERLETERSDLLAQIEAGEGANTALQQLSQENKVLQEKVMDFQKNIDNQSELNNKEKEAFHQQIQQVKGQLLVATDANEKLMADAKDHQTKMKSQQERIIVLDTESKAKVEQLQSMEASKAALRLDLENHLRTNKYALEEKCKELDKVKEKLEINQNELTNKKEEFSALKSQTQEIKEKLKHSENKCTNLESTLEDKNEAFMGVTASRVELSENLKSKCEAMAKLESYVAEQKDNQKSLVQTSEETKKNLESQLKQLIKSKSGLSQQLTELTVDLKSAQKDSQIIQQSLNEKLNMHAKEKETHNNTIQTMEKKFEIEKQEIKSKISQLESDLLENKKVLEAKNIEHERLKVKFNLIDSDINNLTAKINTQEVEIGEKSKDLADIKAKYEKSANECQRLQSQHSVLATKLKSEEEGHSRSKEEVATLTQEIENLQSNIQKIKNEFENENDLREKAQASTFEIEDQLKKVNEQLEENLVNEDQLNCAIKDLTTVKVELSASILKLSEELNTAQTELEQSNSITNMLESDVEEKYKMLKDVEESHSSVLKSMTELKSSYEKYKKETSEELSDLKDAKELLFRQKINFQNQMTALEDKLNEEERNHKVKHDDWCEEKSIHQSETEELKAKFEEKVVANRSLVQQKEENETKYEMQLSALTDNLSMIRSDLIDEQEKNEEVEKRVDELTGNKLELEAKLENAQDERRALLERCLGCEAECDKLRNTTGELRKRYDESLAAMHELGRENQTLQIETQKHVDRKWADDSEAMSCYNCTKQFTVTVRKHHCRKCGKIFCQECSAKQATIASSKKAVRVCDTCYKDATLN